jgi:hypothetical protein
LSVENRRACAGLSLHRLSWYHYGADGSRNSLRSSRHRRRLPTGGPHARPGRQRVGASIHPRGGRNGGQASSWYYCDADGSRNSLRSSRHRRRFPTGGPHARPGRQRVGASIHQRGGRNGGQASSSYYCDADGSRNSCGHPGIDVDSLRGPHARPGRQQVGASVHVKDLRPRPASAPCAARTAPAPPGS